VKRAAALLVLCACTKGTDDGLLPRLKSALAERDRKLSSYRFTAESHQGGQVARHTFAFRSPSKMHGALLEPSRVEWAFDGTTLAQSKPDEKKLTVYALKLPTAKASMFLHDAFMPFVFEGYRAPLLPPVGATAKRIGDDVEVTADVTDGADAVKVGYRFKLPSGDFVSRWSKVNGVESVLQVEEEQCDAKLGLCVPKRVSQRSGTMLIGTTTLTNIELNGELPADGFTLHAGDGWTTETREVSETPP
jgi:outer membrane lipoprotein-sorting protein